MKITAVVERIEATVGIDGKPVRLRSLIEKILINDFQLAAISAAEKAEQIESRVSTTINNRFDTSHSSGTLPILVLEGSAQEFVLGSCYVLPTDSPHIVEAKRNRLFVPLFLAAIRGLTFAEFETFGSKVLKELGAHTVAVTPHSNDQGIDFFGQMNFGKFQPAPVPFFRLAHDIEVFFAGQAKHYPDSALGPDVVRELVGAISLARTKTFSKKIADPFAALLLKPFSPLLALLFTTGTVSSGATALAENAGIIIRGGEQLAVFLADRGVGVSEQGGVKSFDSAKFSLWLAT
jgi:hypothetical protein